MDKLKQKRHQHARQRYALRQVRTKAAKLRQRNPSRKKVRLRASHLKQVICPEILDFDQAPEISALFYDNLEKALFGANINVNVDHRPLKHLSPAAALVLLAHLYRAHRRCPALQLTANLSTQSNVRDLLGLIGYYKYFNPFDWTPPVNQTRFFLAHKRGETVDGSAAKALCEHFQSSGHFNNPNKLYAALVEGMANATEWAYGAKADGYRFWWMIGYRDADSGEIAYSFYDQGAGIPKTIRGKRFTEFLPLLAPTDSDLIHQAVIEGRYSRSKQLGRGTGLPVLFDFVQAAEDGELLIFSTKSRCVFRHAQKAELNDYTIGLRGTLISWSLRPV